MGLDTDFWAEEEAADLDRGLPVARIGTACALVLCLVAMGWAAFGFFPLEYWTQIASLYMHVGFAAGLALSAPVLLVLNVRRVRAWIGRRSPIERLAVLPVLMLAEYVAVDRFGLLGRVLYGGVVTGLLAWIAFALLRSLLSTDPTGRETAEL